MKIYRKEGIVRYLVCLVSSIIVFLSILAPSSELVVLWYMRMSHVVVRSSLSEDMGFGMAVTFWMFLIFIACFPISIYFIWKLSKKTSALRVMIYTICFPFTSYIIWKQLRIFFAELN